MKIVFRTLLILAAALLVAAGFNAFANSGAGQALIAASPGAAGHEGGPPPGMTSRQGAAPELPSGQHRGEREGHSPSLFGLVEVGKNLAIIGVSVALIALGARLLRRGERDEPLPASPEQPSSL